MAAAHISFVLVLSITSGFHTFKHRYTSISGLGSLSIEDGRRNRTRIKALMAPSHVAKDEDALPNIIWMLWLQGWEKAPPLQTECLQSWKLYNPGWEVKAISRDDLPALLGDDFEVYAKIKRDNPDNFQLPGQSDLLRFLILKRYGGVWADSTMLCRRPLDEWLWHVMVAGFFVFAPDGSTFVLGPTPPFVSSFIAATPEHAIVVSSYKRFVSYWEGKPDGVGGPLGYFWSHLLVGKSVGLDEFSSGDDHGDKGAINMWQLMPKRTGEFGQSGPNLFIEHGWFSNAYRKLIDAPASRDTQAMIRCDKETPMLKLSGRQSLVSEIDNPRSGIHLLLAVTMKAAVAYSKCSQDKTCLPWHAQEEQACANWRAITPDTMIRSGSYPFWFQITVFGAIVVCGTLCLIRWMNSGVQELLDK